MQQSGRCEGKRDTKEARKFEGFVGEVSRWRGFDEMLTVSGSTCITFYYIFVKF